MQVVVQGGNIGMAIQELKRKILKDGIFKSLKEREEPSLSIRRRNKERKAERRRVKRNGARNEVRKAS